jgi:hypothetical protein
VQVLLLLVTRDKAWLHAAIILGRKITQHCRVSSTTVSVVYILTISGSRGSVDRIIVMAGLSNSLKKGKKRHEQPKAG